MPDLTITEAIACGVVFAVLLIVLAWVVVGSADALGAEYRQ